MLIITGDGVAAFQSDFPLIWSPNASKGLSPWMVSQAGGLYGDVVPRQL